jgi:hypothetical protein
MDRAERLCRQVAANPARGHLLLELRRRLYRLRIRSGSALSEFHGVSDLIRRHGLTQAQWRSEAEFMGWGRTLKPYRGNKISFFLRARLGLVRFSP